MVIEDVGEVIAERTFTLDSEGESATLTLRLGKPRPFPDNEGFFCPFEVAGIGERKVRYAAGLDEFQSLQLALQLIPAVLHVYQKAADGRLYWLEPGDDLGFPRQEPRLP
jgi:hypothetical protein